ncbi:deoxyribodipyrimidine photo-lyase [Brucella anthropi]|nr:deoxyribodipyrimidine photo-lyase [Brucella anthropi]UVV69519.1 deoxyribodipyrimidine photo-lyase [Brucella anthropi]
MTAKALVWLRNDLRRADNPALHAASKLGGHGHDPFRT